jgi:hypothetical protein
MGSLERKFGCVGFGLVLIIIGGILMGTGYGKEDQLEKDKISHQVQSFEIVLDAPYTNTTCYNIIIKSNQACFDFDFQVGYVANNQTIITQELHKNCYDLTTDCRSLLVRIEDICKPIYYFDYNITGWSYDKYTGGGFQTGQVQDMIAWGIGLFVSGCVIAGVSILHPCKL